MTQWYVPWSYIPSSPYEELPVWIFVRWRKSQDYHQYIFNSLEATKNYVCPENITSLFFQLIEFLMIIKNTVELHISLFVFPNTASVWSFHNDSTSGSTIFKITIVILLVWDVRAYTFRPLLVRKVVSLNKVVPKNS